NTHTIVHTWSSNTVVHDLASPTIGPVFKSFRQLHQWQASHFISHWAYWTIVAGKISARTLRHSSERDSSSTGCATFHKFTTVYNGFNGQITLAFQKFRASIHWVISTVRDIVHLAMSAMSRPGRLPLLYERAASLR